MKKIQAWILTALLFTAMPAGAQKRNAAVKGKAAAAMRNNGNGGRLLFNTLLPATAKVMVIDSVVVPNWATDDSMPWATALPLRYTCRPR